METTSLIQDLMNPQTKKQKRQLDLIAAALELFLKKGYAGATTKEIAAACNMSQSLFFHYFSSKEELYEWIIEIGIAGPESMMSGTKCVPLDFFRSSAEFLLKQFSMSRFMTEMFVFMEQIRHNPESIPDRFRAILLSDEMIFPAVDIIRKGQNDGSIKQGDPTALAMTFWGAIEGIAQTLYLYPKAPIPDADWLVDILRKV